MSDSTQAYCFKCHEKRDILNATAVYTENAKPATTGTCPVCGTKMFRMGMTAAHDGVPKPTAVANAKPARKTAASKTKPAVKAKTKTSAKTAVASSKVAAKPANKKAAASDAAADTTAKPKRAASGAADKPKKTAAAKKSKAASAVPAAPRKRRGKLVIVESPAKARTVGRYLGDGYVVKASKGHVRDLLVTQLSVDVNNGFEPKYRVPNDKRDTVKDLQRAVDNAEEIFLATDPDREGEAIAWHLMAATEMDESRARRVVFHEITDAAVKHAFDNPRAVDMNLVNAQQARRVLDRIVGYGITELLWDRVRNRLSAGRVQSVALRFVVEREQEIGAFVTEEYCTVDALLEKQGKNGKPIQPFSARLVKYKGEDLALTTQADVLPHLDILERSRYQVVEVKRGVRQRKPSAPFTTSTLQQEASRRFGFSAKRTMKAAQELYEGIELGKEGVVGLITYMRTDSTTVSEQAQKDARSYIQTRFGKDSMPERAPIYKTKAKGAQEAHEAVRPTLITREPARLQSILSRDQYRLYTLIWERFVASQMSNAVYDTLRVEIAAGLTADDTPYLLRVSGRTIKFAGFLALYEDARDEDANEDR
ncbi:MAG: type I DNA topoisomerase, partial [Armatimonadetes bacterium]|nr:type I DNA topoisomerase [Anaerolineae bacterium]